MPLPATRYRLESVAACPVPVRRPVMVQRWVDVVFLHWRVERAAVQRLLPPGVTVDVFDGSAWVGLVPFSMEGLGLPGLAPLPLVGSFPEVNVRTYVRAGGHRGVWFFSLDIDRLVPLVVARGVYCLPYCWARASHERVGDVVSSHVDRRWPVGSSDVGTKITVRTGARVDGSEELTRFLTARWGLVSASRSGRLRWAPVDHPVWPLFTADVVRLDDRLVAAAELPVSGAPDHALWSPGVPVRIGRPRRIARHV